jgi:GDPmannose 4,6-dehydratase
MNKKKALITGISGQDGSYLAKLLLSKGYAVYGTSRDAQVSSFQNLKRLGIKETVTLLSMALNDFRSVLQTLDTVKPDEIYNLAGQSSVSLSFEQPMETLESHGLGTFNLLEVIRFLQHPTKLYSAGSSDCFGNTGGVAADEATLFHPRSPYAVAKSTSHWAVANYREAYNLFACTGILFNHESPLRPERFVTRKIISSACRIASGSDEKLKLGNISIARDWGWSPEYVDAMWRMLQQEVPCDYVIATGETNKLQDFVDEAFAQMNLDWKDHVFIDESLLRPSEIMISRGNPLKAEKELGWKARYLMGDVIRMMTDEELGRERGSIG